MGEWDGSETWLIPYSGSVLGCVAASGFKPSTTRTQSLSSMPHSCYTILLGWLVSIVCEEARQLMRLQGSMSESLHAAANFTGPGRPGTQRPELHITWSLLRLLGRGQLTSRTLLSSLSCVQRSGIRLDRALLTTPQAFRVSWSRSVYSLPPTLDWLCLTQEMFLTAMRGFFRNNMFPLSTVFDELFRYAVQEFTYPAMLELMQGRWHLLQLEWWVLGWLEDWDHVAEFVLRGWPCLTTQVRLVTTYEPRHQSGYVKMTANAMRIHPVIPSPEPAEDIPFLSLQDLICQENQRPFQIRYWGSEQARDITAQVLLQ
jgi:hypothetical protein